MPVLTTSRMVRLLLRRGRVVTRERNGCWLSKDLLIRGAIVGILVMLLVSLARLSRSCMLIGGLLRIALQFHYNS